MPGGDGGDSTARAPGLAVAVVVDEPGMRGRPSRPRQTPSASGARPARHAPGPRRPPVWVARRQLRARGPWIWPAPGFVPTSVEGRRARWPRFIQTRSVARGKSVPRHGRYSAQRPAVLQTARGHRPAAEGVRGRSTRPSPWLPSTLLVRAPLRAGPAASRNHGAHACQRQPHPCHRRQRPSLGRTDRFFSGLGRFTVRFRWLVIALGSPSRHFEYCSASLGSESTTTTRSSCPTAPPATKPPRWPPRSSGASASRARSSSWAALAGSSPSAWPCPSQCRRT